jgi:nucleoid-associated protein YgaU
MPNDAKLGLVVGVGLVIAVAVVLFRRDVPGLSARGGTDAQTSLVGTPPAGAGPRARGGGPGPLPAPGNGGTRGGPRSHTVEEGETLVSVARHYYGDPDKSTALFRANRDRLRAPNHVPVGTVLLIPDEADLALAGASGR